MRRSLRRYAFADQGRDRRREARGRGAGFGGWAAPGAERVLATGRARAWFLASGLAGGCWKQRELTFVAFDGRE